MRLFFFCGVTGNRTRDTRIFSPLLYQLSYDTKNICLKCGWQGSECSAVGSALRSGRRGRAFESPHSDQRAEVDTIQLPFIFFDNRTPDPLTLGNGNARRAIFLPKVRGKMTHS